MSHTQNFLVQKELDDFIDKNVRRTKVVAHERYNNIYFHAGYSEHCLILKSQTDQKYSLSFAVYSLLRKKLFQSLIWNNFADHCWQTLTLRAEVIGKANARNRWPNFIKFWNHLWKRSLRSSHYAIFGMRKPY